MTTPTAIHRDITLNLIREAAEWRLLALLFVCPQGDWRAQIAALAGEVSDEALQQAAQAALEDGHEADYHTAFGPGGPAAPREISHRQSTLSGQYLAELLACYYAFAYRPPRDEPPDHVAVELDFIAYLQLKHAFAEATNNDVQATETLNAARQFIDDHVSTIAGPLAKSFASSNIRYLTLAAAALTKRVGPLVSTASPEQPALDPPRDLALPICDSDDCCTELMDVEPFG